MESTRDNRLVVIHQPDFLPYLGFFDRLLQADIYVVLDTVQYVNGSSNSWMNRDKIKTPKGEQWLTVCVNKAPRETSIQQIYLLEDNKWREHNLNLIRENYRKAQYFNEIFPYIEQLYKINAEKMMDFNFASIKMLMELFDIEIDIKFASELPAKGKNNELVIDIVKCLGCRRYLSGVGAKDYYKPEPYNRAGVEVVWQNFVHPVYPQQFGEFIPYLSSIDLLFNCGIAHSRRIIRGETI